VSHIHWDHIQGFPFFDPIYQPNRAIYILPLEVEALFCRLIEQMDGVHFRVTPEDLPSQRHYITGNGVGFLREHGFNVSRIALNHPGGGYGYRIENGGRSVVYLTDNELHPPHDNKTNDLSEFIQFCKDADVLIHDAQYIKQDMPQKHGWGHSLVSQACELAVAAEVKHLVLFHHDPDRTDNELDSIQEDARSWFKTNDQRIQCTAAFEGLTLDM
jgi:phosphoribosyl 1,2-cyclic phosphodiesterase